MAQLKALGKACSSQDSASCGCGPFVVSLLASSNSHSTFGGHALCEVALAEAVEQGTGGGGAVAEAGAPASNSRA